MSGMKVITQLLLDHISFNRARRDRSSNMHFNVDTRLNMTEDLTMNYPAMHFPVMAHLTWWTGKLYPFHQAHNLCFRHTEMQNLKQRRIIIREIIELDESYRLMQRSLLVHVVSWIWKLLIFHIGEDVRQDWLIPLSVDLNELYRTVYISMLAHIDRRIHEINMLV